MTWPRTVDLGLHHLDVSPPIRPGPRCANVWILLACPHRATSRPSWFLVVGQPSRTRPKRPNSLTVAGDSYVGAWQSSVSMSPSA